MKSKINISVFIIYAFITCACAKYGHQEYEEADRNDLVIAGRYADGRNKYLEENTFYAFQRMKNAAEKDGVELTLISAYRSVKYQKWLFSRAVKRYGSEQEAARHVAPPGGSEHHTGTAVDIGDGSRPDTDLKTSFEKTPAHTWLKQYAEEYGFTLSFPKGNKQGVSYEPWHWRYTQKTKAE